MASHWLAERVAVVDYHRALRNVVLGENDRAWGPNNRFSFPVAGGTDAEARAVRCNDGGERRYGALVSTMPLDRLVDTLTACPDEVRTAAGRLEHNGVYMVGVGYEQPLVDDRSWLYFPQDSAPFYRATNFAKYAAANVPGADVGRYSSYMTEVSHSADKPEPRTGLEERVEAGLRRAGVVGGRPGVASMHVVDIRYAYPVPTLARDRSLATIQPWLMVNDIYSRGRFGSWRYEIGNMDHSVKMGIDIARLLVDGTTEELWTK